MTNRQSVHLPGIREPDNPYSFGIKTDGLVFVSGQVAADLDTGEVVGLGDIRVQTKAVLENIETVLRAAGTGLDQLVKTTVFLADIGEFQAMNEAYREVVPAPRPARSTVQATLASPEFLVEIEAICLLDVSEGFQGAPSYCAR